MDGLVFLFLLLFTVVAIAALKRAVQSRTGAAHLLKQLQSSSASPEQGAALARGLAARRNRALLEQFEARLRQHGCGSTSLDDWGADAKVCGLIAGQFAQLVNGGRLAPAEDYSSRDLAVAWIGAVATDMATQKAGVDFELAGLAMPLSVLALEDLATTSAETIGGRVADFGTIAFEVHNHLAATMDANDTAAHIAQCFLGWAIEGDDAGLLVIREAVPKIAANIASTITRTRQGR